MIYAYMMMFWLPPIVSGICLVIAWSLGILNRPLVPLVWFVLALALQVVGQTFSPAWAVGLGLQAVLAVYLVIRVKTFA